MQIIFKEQNIINLITCFTADYKNFKIFLFQLIFIYIFTEIIFCAKKIIYNAIDYTQLIISSHYII